MVRILACITDTRCDLLVDDLDLVALDSLRIEVTVGGDHKLLTGDAQTPQRQVVRRGTLLVEHAELGKAALVYAIERKPLGLLMEAIPVAT